jgi:hypothetical protein
MAYIQILSAERLSKSVIANPGKPGVAIRPDLICWMFILLNELTLYRDKKLFLFPLYHDLTFISQSFQTKADCLSKWRGLVANKNNFFVSGNSLWKLYHIHLG